MTVDVITVEHAGFTLSQLIWRTYQRQPAGFLEQVLDLNPGIAANIALPVGTQVKMPVDAVVEDSASPADVVRLWD